MNIYPEDELLCALQSGELEAVTDVTVHSVPPNIDMRIIRSARPWKYLAW